MSRRVAALIAGALGTVVFDRAGLFRAILCRYLPDAILPEKEIEEFTKAFLPIIEKQYGSRTLLRMLRDADRMFCPEKRRGWSFLNAKC